MDRAPEDVSIGVGRYRWQRERTAAGVGRYPHMHHINGCYILYEYSDLLASERLNVVHLGKLPETCERYRHNGPLAKVR